MRRSNLAAVGALALLCLALAALIGVSGPPAGSAGLREFQFHHDNVLGTSLDLVVFAPGEAEAQACEQAILNEIERLRKILSTYDPESEISRLNRATGPLPCSVELVEVLRGYEDWQRRSGGAFNGQIGGLVGLWMEAERSGVLPDDDRLQQIVAAIHQPGWIIDDVNSTLTRRTTLPLNVNAIGKGYIIEKAAAAGRSKVPSVSGLLVNIGGDMRLVGRGGPVDGMPWRIGVTDPARPADNAMPLAQLCLGEGAVATSGNYQRYYTINGRRYSHLLDPRTGRPADGVASATVVAPDNVTANALATTLCVLAPEEGLRLVRRTPGAHCLLVCTDGRQLRSDGWIDLEVCSTLAEECAASAAALPWPTGYEVSITLVLSEQPEAKKYRRPYVAVWIENLDGKPVRSLTCWGNQSKYQKDLTSWWRITAGNASMIKAVTRATRPPGKYQLAWDGLDDRGNPVDQGTYKVHVEVHREHGKHVRQTGTIECRAGKASVTLEATAENKETLVEYGPKGK